MGVNLTKGLRTGLAVTATTLGVAGALAFASPASATAWHGHDDGDNKINETNQDCENRQGAATGAGVINVPVNANVLQCSDDLARVGILSFLA